MKHEGFTPGPWYALGKSVRREGAGLDMLDHIAECQSHRGPITITRTEAEANARLIADAPALLAENDRLRATLERISTHSAKDDFTEMNMRDIARAALEVSK